MEGYGLNGSSIINHHVGGHNYTLGCCGCLAMLTGCFRRSKFCTRTKKCIGLIMIVVMYSSYMHFS